MSYKEQQRNLQIDKLYNIIPSIFNYDKGFGDFEIYRSLKFMLLDGKNNLFKGIVEDTNKYFQKNNIAWWGENEKYPSGHLLSSQIQCLNYLFALRKDKEATLKLAQLFDPNIEDILPTINDKDPGFISFEFTYENAQLLKETNKYAHRGSFCTSIDVFMIVVRNSEKVLIPIEWKYTETYLESKNKAYNGNENKYFPLIENSIQLKTSDDLANSCYYYEPFYELMRQTLLTEQMVKSDLADNFLHILIVPSENKDLLEYNYLGSNEGLEEMWRNCLTDQTKFKIIDSKQILAAIKSMPSYTELAQYLVNRY